MISSRMGSVQPSMTMAVTHKASLLKAQGKPVISLSMGEPDFDTPQHIKQAAIEAINKGKTKYTAAGGIDALKEAVIHKLAQDNNLHYDKNQIIIGSGAKQVIYNAFGASIDPGDEVIIPAPYWVSYADIISIFGGKPVCVETNDSFLLEPETLRMAITNKTKWLVLNFPNNPTGICAPRSNLESIAEVLMQNKHVYVLSDDIYEYILYDNCQFHNIASIKPELKDRVFIVNGVSKSYSMTGWRIGYGAGNEELVKAMSTIQSQSTSCPCSISQEASLIALRSPNDFLKDWMEQFCYRRNLMLNTINSIGSLSCIKPQGAFYLFPSITKIIGSKTPKGEVINSDTDFANYLISDHLLAVVPGVAFGKANHFRLSYAASVQTLQSACHKLQEACQALE